ncbi:MAG: alpha/beta fold hydrolase [Deltaproteobacteria bacterium]|nr:alpha/beta fold hydrolase [Deltaproteobacteria bacterium]
MRAAWLLTVVVALAGCGDDDDGPRPDGAAVADAAGPDAAEPCAAGATCRVGRGLCAPTPYCSVAMPCPNALVGITTNTTVTEPITVPARCQTSQASRPQFDDGAPRRWTDAPTGLERAACVFRPAGSAQRPLVLFMHGSGGSAATVYDTTSLRSKATSYDFGTGAGAGFVLAADQGPSSPIPNGNPPSSRHEFYYRDLGSPSSNPDFRAIDRLIDDLVAEGGVDPRRIYLLGWSNGAFFSQAYGLARHTTATPGGNRVAAVVAFDGANPFAAPRATAMFDGCAFDPLPQVALPVMLIHRACSIIPCDAAQAAAMTQPPGYEVAAWETTLRTQIGARDVENVIIAGTGAIVTSCTAATSCGAALAAVNHIRWPDGVADGSGIDHEGAMLDYLRAHPLP